jgi:ATP-binding cassette subfamily B protein
MTKKIEALKDISFTIKKKEKQPILGKTGSGKSSLLSLISRLYDNNHEAQ